MHTDEVKLYWNDAEIPPEAQRRADWTYQLRPRPEHSTGYRLHVDLKRAGLPQVGTNCLRVDLIKKDATLIHSVSVKHVEVVIEYLPHRNALRDDETFEE